ncbi:GSCOCG00004885001-RA-CDS [Cotesia congregata]|nr:GSCOCG00004885001-RA-CDS [Cotesia congregata]
MYPIKIAILAQKAWKNAGFIYQGLLAGMAFIHFILIQIYFKPLKKPIEDYSIIAEIYTNLFSFFIVMCIISAFDRFDLAHFDIEHFRGLYNNYAKAMTVIPLYIAVFCLHQATLSVNDKLVLLNYTKNTTSYMSENITTTTISDEELENWKAITLTKDGIVVVAWLLVSFGPPNDMLLTHLKSLEKYHNSEYY